MPPPGLCFLYSVPEGAETQRLHCPGSLLILANGRPGRDLGEQEEKRRQGMCYLFHLSASGNISAAATSPLAPISGSRMLLPVMPPFHCPFGPEVVAASPCCYPLGCLTILSLESQWFHHLYNQVPALQFLSLKDLEFFLFYYHSMCWHWILSFCILHTLKQSSQIMDVLTIFRRDDS